MATTARNSVNFSFSQIQVALAATNKIADFLRSQGFDISPSLRGFSLHSFKENWSEENGQGAYWAEDGSTYFIGDGTRIFRLTPSNNEYTPTPQNVPVWDGKVEWLGYAPPISQITVESGAFRGEMPEGTPFLVLDSGMANWEIDNEEGLFYPTIFVELTNDGDVRVYHINPSSHDAIEWGTDMFVRYGMSDAIEAYTDSQGTSYREEEYNNSDNPTIETSIIPANPIVWEYTVRSVNGNEDTAEVTASMIANCSIGDCWSASGGGNLWDQSKSLTVIHRTENTVVCEEEYKYSEGQGRKERSVNILFFQV